MVNPNLPRIKFLGRLGFVVNKDFMATVVIDSSELDYYKSCAAKMRKILEILKEKKQSDEEKLNGIKKVIERK